jgi:dCTP deaminase
MVLSDTEIRAALESGQIIIQPMPRLEQYRVASLDLTLGTEFFRWKLPEHGTGLCIDPSSADSIVPLSGDSDQTLAGVLMERVPTDADGAAVVHSGELILARTTERVELPRSARLAARVEGRSSLARVGLGVHLTAGTIQPGFKGLIALEIINHGPLPIRLRPGLAICQLVFEVIFGTPSRELRGLFFENTGRTE